jgi:Na+-transporting NADH:ubiquinone oxidoreductase subunit NqrC
MKVVLVFLILMVSISIVSEYICLKTIRMQENYITKEQKIDAFLADLKNTLMKKENFESYTVPQEVVCKNSKIFEIVNEATQGPEMPQEIAKQPEETPEVSPTAPVVSQNFPEVSPTAPVVSKKPLGVLLPGFEPISFSFAEVNF